MNIKQICAQPPVVTSKKDKIIMKKIIYITIFISLLISCNNQKGTKQETNNPGVIKTLNEKNIESEKEIKPRIDKSHTADTLNILSKFLSKSIKNYSIIDWRKGDINNDKIDDFIVVLQSDIPDNEITGIDNTYKRTVVLLVTLKSFPNFKIAAINHNVVECSTCGGAGVGDPYQGGISIEDNYFSIGQLFGACDKTKIFYTFKFENNNWFLYEMRLENQSCQLDEEGFLKEPTYETYTQKDLGLIKFEDYLKDEDY